MSLMKAACSKTPQYLGTPMPQGEANLYQVTEEKARNAMAATTDAEQTQLQAQFKARQTDFLLFCLKANNFNPGYDQT